MGKDTKISVFVDSDVSLCNQRIDDLETCSPSLLPRCTDTLRFPCVIGIVFTISFSSSAGSPRTRINSDCIAKFMRRMNKMFGFRCVTNMKIEFRFSMTKKTFRAMSALSAPIEICITRDYFSKFTNLKDICIVSGLEKIHTKDYAGPTLFSFVLSKKMLLHNRNVETFSFCLSSQCMEIAFIPPALFLSCSAKLQKLEIAMRRQNFRCRGKTTIGSTENCFVTPLSVLKKYKCWNVNFDCPVPFPEKSLSSLEVFALYGAELAVPAVAADSVAITRRRSDSNQKKEVEQKGIFSTNRASKNQKRKKAASAPAVAEQLHTLKLTKNALDDKKYLALLRALFPPEQNKIWKLQVLEIMDNNISKRIPHDLFGDRFPCLLTADFSYNQIEDFDYSDAPHHPFRWCGSMKTINFAHNAIRKIAAATKKAIRKIAAATAKAIISPHHVHTTQSPDIVLGTDTGKPFLMHPPAEVLHSSNQYDDDVQFYKVTYHPTTDFSPIDEADIEINLRMIDFSHNRISEIPDDFFALHSTGLREIDFSHNQLTKLPTTPLSQTSLEVIDFAHNQITELRNDSIFSRRYNDYGYCYINFSRNKIARIDVTDDDDEDAEKQEKPTATTLKLSHNLLRALPKNVTRRLGEGLRSINISHNCIEHLDPDLFVENENLKDFNCSYNRIVTFPEELFVSCHKLEKIKISYNYVYKSEAPKRFLERWLRSANVSNHLQYLDVSRCGLKRLPLSLVGCKKLTDVEWRNNPFKQHNFDAAEFTRFCMARNTNEYYSVKEKEKATTTSFLETKESIYSMSEAVHNTNVENDTRNSIRRFMNEYFVLPKNGGSAASEAIAMLASALPQEALSAETMSDLLTILRATTFNNIIDDGNEISITFGVSFNDLLYAVLHFILHCYAADESDAEVQRQKREDLLAILDDEMRASGYLCYEGRITRLISTLNGDFTITNGDRRPLVRIGINEHDQIINLYSMIIRKHSAADEETQKAAFREELAGRSYGPEIIEHWMSAFE